MARARKPPMTAPGDSPGDLAAEHERLLLEVQRLSLECKGLRYDNAVKTRERDTLLKENIALRKGEQNRQREADLRQREVTLNFREAALDRRAAERFSEVAALRRQIEVSESQLRLAQIADILP